LLIYTTKNGGYGYKSIELAELYTSRLKFLVIKGPLQWALLCNRIAFLFLDNRRCKECSTWEIC